MLKLKKITATLLAVAMMASVGTSVFADDVEVTIENGVKTTEGSVTVPSIEINGQIFSNNKQRAMFLEYVGLAPDDVGPWEHGVIGNTVISRYVNRKYWHGSSALGSIDNLIRSTLAPAGLVAHSESRTASTNGNRAFWRVEQNM